jgi:hypothetical protein
MHKCDDSLKSFLLTLKSLHNIPARKFALNAESKQFAIRCNSSYGLIFGGIIVSGFSAPSDIYLSHNCNADTHSSTSLGGAYTNGTGLDAKVFFTGSFHFQVREIEVSEITDSTTLPNNLLAFPRFCANPIGIQSANMTITQPNAANSSQRHTCVIGQTSPSSLPSVPSLPNACFRLCLVNGN